MPILLSSRRLLSSLPALAAGLILSAAGLRADPAGEWSPVTITNPELRAKGTLTGDGCQWFRALAIDSTEGNFMLWCTDVGGLFRSLDTGKTWEPANVGFDSRGSSGVAIDPNNPKRVIVVAANSVPEIQNGLYLSTDQAASWQQVLPVKMSASQDRRIQVAFDPSTYDDVAKLTKRVYWSTLSKDPAQNPAWGETMADPAFYTSDDGGQTWARLPGGEKLADANLAVAPTGGDLYAALPDGFRVSRDGAKTWETTMEGETTGVAVSKAAPESVWVSQPGGVFRSDDRGATFERLPAADALAGADVELKNIAVAPSDADSLFIARIAPEYDWTRFYSHDGGKTWQQSQLIKDRVIVPTNAREALFSIHPKDPSIILAPGGDYPMLSHNGGATYTLAGNGVNNIFVGGALQFSVLDPDVLFFGSQDYATFLTTDGGRNWKYLEPAAKGWGGYNYAGYASVPSALVVGDAEGWSTPKRRSVSTDGGATWDISDEALGSYASYGDPRDENVLFAGVHRSADGGRTWKKMAGAVAVYTHDPGSGTLFGVDGAVEDDNRSAVRSDDHGVTWETIFTMDGGGIRDLAFDPQRQRLYVAANEKLQYWENGEFTEVTTLVPDQKGSPDIRSVAVDPVDPGIVYVAGNRNRFASDASAQRSFDAGKTWESLTRTTPLDGTGLDGGRESMWVRVNAKTREPWFATNCYGIWRYSAPPSQRTDDPSPAGD